MRLEAIAEAKAKAKEAAAKAATVKEEMIDDFIARVDREASAKAARRALQAGRPSSSAAPPESSADEEITGAFTAEGLGRWLQARAPAGSFLSRGTSAFCTCVQITWHRSLRWFPSHRRGVG